VVDFAIYEDYKLQQMAGAVLDYMFFNMAADSRRGVFGATHSRYSLPKILADIATDETAVVESRVRQGILQGAALHADFCVQRRERVLDPRGAGDAARQDRHLLVVPPHLWGGLGAAARLLVGTHHAAARDPVPQRDGAHLALESLCLDDALLLRAEERFDEVRFGGNWAFARVGRGYVGIHS